LATANHAKPQSSSVVGKRSVSGRAHMAVLCQRRASDWADAIRDGLDPDIASFVREQARAWRLLANTYAGFARRTKTSRDSKALSIFQ
jgi:hypothetical protein